MSKKKIYLHVGPHKTGTTVLQKACLDHRTILNESQLDYPEIFFSHLGHHHLVDKIRSRQISSEEIALMREQPFDLLLSSENYIALTPADWQFFKKTFHEFDIYVIYSWRRSSHKMYSLWQESIKQGGHTSFYAFYYNDLIKPGSSELLAQDIKVRQLADTFGRNKLTILDYESLSEQGTMVETFFNLLGVDGKKIDISTHDDGIVNAALDPKTTELLRCLNGVYSQQNLQTSRLTRERFFAMSLSLSSLTDKCLEKMNGYELSVQIGNYFVDRHSDNAITKNFGDRVVSYNQYNKEKTITIINPDWLLNREAVAYVHQLYQVLYSEQSSLK